MPVYLWWWGMGTLWCEMLGGLFRGRTWGCQSVTGVHRWLHFVYLVPASVPRPGVRWRDGGAMKKSLLDWKSHTAFVWPSYIADKSALPTRLLAFGGDQLHFDDSPGTYLSIRNMWLWVSVMGLCTFRSLDGVVGLWPFPNLLRLFVACSDVQFFLKHTGPKTNHDKSILPLCARN
jgi:hypothetical protein